MNCPNCGGRSIGRVGTAQYYCWECCVEFNLGRGGLRIFHLNADGELTVAGPPAEACAQADPGHLPP